MSWAEWAILTATSGYFVAAALYLKDGDLARFGVFGMYGLCNILIALWVK